MISPLSVSSLKIFLKKPKNPEENKQLFSYDVCSTGAKNFFFSTYEDMYNLIKSQENNNYYEDNTFNEKMKLFIDIDYNLELNTELEQDKIIEKILDDILIQMKLNETKLIVLKSDTLKKISLHLIYPEIIFKNIRDMKYYMKEIKNIDHNVYKTGCFRMLYNSKYGKNNILRLYKLYNYTKNLDDKELFYQSCVYNVSNNIKNMEIEILQNEKIFKKVNIKSKIINRDYFYEKVNLEKVKLMLSKMKNDTYQEWILTAFGMKDLYLSSNNKEKIYELFDEYSKGSEKYNEENNRKIFMSLEPYNENINVLFEKCGIDYRCKMINKNYEKLLFNKSKHNVIEIERKYLTSKSNKLEDYLEKIILNDIIYIKSPTGTGKTTFTRKLRNIFPQNIISITCRVNLAGEHMKSLNLEFYKDVKNMRECKKLVIQLESLYKCNYKNFIDGTLLLDETNALLSQFRSPTMTNKRKENYLYLIELIKNAKKIVCLDADLCDWNIEFIQRIRNDKYVILYNTIKNKLNVDAVFYKSYNVLISKMKKMIENKEYFVCCFDSKSWMYKIIEYLGNDKSWKIYSSDEKADKVETEEWKKTFVFYTPSISQGIDYNNEKSCEVFSLTFKNHLNPLIIYQMINRTRNISKVNLYCNENENTVKFKSLEDVKEETESMIKFFSELTKYDYLIDEESYKVIYNNYNFIDELLRTNINYYLKDIMKNKGFNIKENEEEMEDLLFMKMTKKDKIHEKIVSILGLDINNLTEEQRELVSDSKKIEQYFNYKLYIDGKIMLKIEESIEHSLLTESVKSRSTKILLLKNLMKTLGIIKIQDVNKNVCKNFGSKINDEWLNENFEYIKKTFRILGTKYNKNDYYKIYIMMITIMKQLFGNDIVKNCRLKENNINYRHYIFSNKKIYKIEYDFID